MYNILFARLLLQLVRLQAPLKMWHPAYLVAGADPGFQKGGGGGWQTIFIEGW